MTTTALEFGVSGIPLGELRVIAVEGEEELERPFRFEVIFGSADPALDLDRALGSAAALTFRRAGARRVVEGCIGALEQGDQADDGAYLYRASLVPHLAGGSALLDGAAPVVLEYREAADPRDGDAIFRVRCVAGREAVGLAQRRRRQGRPILLGESRACTLSAGRRFMLSGHFRDDLNGEYAIIKVSHGADAGGYKAAIEAVRASETLRNKRSTSLPLAKHLGATDAFSDQDVTPDPDHNVGSWARIHVPNTDVANPKPVGYYRLGAVPISDVEVTSYHTPFTTNWTAGGWPGAVAGLVGSFLYTDRSRTSVSGQDANTYAGRHAYEYVTTDAYAFAGGKRKVEVGSATGAATSREEASYKPGDTAGAFTPPAFLTGGASPASSNVAYADSVELKGNVALKVWDLLIEDVRGDRVSYTAGGHRGYVGGNHYIEIYGDEETTVDKTQNKTIYGDERKYNKGALMSIRMGAIFDVTIGAWTTIALAVYVRIINSRMTFFMFKFDYVVGTKVDFGGIKIDGYMGKIDNKNLTIGKVLGPWIVDTSVLLRLGKIVIDKAAACCSSGICCCQ